MCVKAVRLMGKCIPQPICLPVKMMKHFNYVCRPVLPSPMYPILNRSIFFKITIIIIMDLFCGLFFLS